MPPPRVPAGWRNTSSPWCMGTPDGLPASPPRAADPSPERGEDVDMLPESRRGCAHNGRGRGTVATRAEHAEWQRGVTCGDLLVGVPRARPTYSLLHPRTKGRMRSSTCTTTRVNRALVQRVLGGFRSTTGPSHSRCPSRGHSTQVEGCKGQNLGVQGLHQKT